MLKVLLYGYSPGTFLSKNTFYKHKPNLISEVLRL